MPGIKGIDHVALTVADLKTATDFYARVFGATRKSAYEKDGKVLQCVMTFGPAALSFHQYGNGVDLVARVPTPGSGDLCFRWDGPIDSAVAHLGQHDVAIVDGPSVRTYSDGTPTHSVYFKDPDGNLIELMAAD